MDQEHEAHLKRVKFQIAELLDSKYRKGQAEHGGKLWEKAGIIPNLVDEMTDFVVYLLTLREQYEKLGVPEDAKLRFTEGGGIPEVCPTCGGNIKRGEDESVTSTGSVGKVQYSSGTDPSPIRLGDQSGGVTETGPEVGGVYVGQSGVDNDGQAGHISDTRVDQLSGSKTGS